MATKRYSVIQITRFFAENVGEFTPEEGRGIGKLIRLLESK